MFRRVVYTAMFPSMYVRITSSCGAWASEAKEVHLMFNNCYANYGTTNAREVAALLADLETSQS